MQKHIQVYKKQSGLFGYLLLLTVFFIFLELSLIIQYSNVYLNDFQFIAGHLKIPAAIAPGVFFFLLVQIFLHLAFTILVWGAARLIGVAFHCSWKTIEKVGFTLWVFGIVTILLGNQCLFPNSKFSILTGFIINQTLAKILLAILLASLAIAFLISIRGLFSLLSTKIKLCLSFLFLCFILFFSFQYYSHSNVTDAATNEKPNIIFIGIDALRPDFLGYFGYEKIAPHIDNFLDHASVFSDSLTPLARTFPSWVSILTGKHPQHTGARTNLIDQSEIKLENPLPRLLKNLGYQTIFSTDETRFSNISINFGFDSIITPPMGFNDFLVGTINDFPISNLLVNTFVGKYFFPYSYANRPVAITYNPDSFLDLLEPILSKPRTKPLFLAVHFCLPHLPYTWGTEVAFNDPALPYPIVVKRNYQAAIKRVDQQFNDFLSLLKKNNLLDHSIVIFLSDHGEAIEMPGDRATDAGLFVAGAKNKENKIPHFYPPNLENEAVDRSAGHGTDVLGLSQYHTVLAFKLYGLEKNRQAAISGRVSLLDIQPTVLDFLNQDHSKNDGNSLKKFILGKQHYVPPKTHFFTESDFSPQAIHAVFPETRKVILEGVEYFQIDPVSTKLTVRKSMEKMIYSSKQFADFYGTWMLALYPQNNKEMIPILLNLEDGHWTDDLTTSFAKSSPAKHMLKALKIFYGNQISSIVKS